MTDHATSSPEPSEQPTIDASSAVSAALLDQLEDIHVELTEARIAAADGDLALVRAWLELSEKVIGGRITELKQARLEAKS